MSTTPTEPTAERAALAERIKELADRWAEGPATRIRFPDTRAQLHAAIDKLLAALSPSPASTEVPPQPCVHDWVIWPETDGQEQRCLCGAYRPTPESDKFWKKSAPSPAEVPAEPVAWRLTISNGEVLYEDEDPREGYSQEWLEGCREVLPLYAHRERK